MNTWIRFPVCPVRGVDDTPARPGLYAIFSRNQPIYVGMSNRSVRHGLWAHLRRRTDPGWFGSKGFAEGNWFHHSELSIRWRPPNPGERLVVSERKLIRRLNPRFNIDGRTGRPAFDEWEDRYLEQLREEARSAHV